jgi:hypothetical protein
MEGIIKYRKTHPGGDKKVVNTVLMEKNKLLDCFLPHRWW